MDQEALFEQIIKAIQDGDKETSSNCTKAYLDIGGNPYKCLKEALIPAMASVSKGWDNGEYFLPDVILSAGAMKASSLLLQEVISSKEGRDITKGVIVLGTIRGDIHDIGKDLANAILTGGLFQVYDIGVDRSPQAFIEKAQEVNADIIGVSCLLTGCLPQVEILIDRLKEMNLKDKFRVLVGGGALTADMVTKLGADGFAREPQSIVPEAERLMDL